MFKINGDLLPIKAHYFFFMAAMGPILPQINVFGKELGISPDVMGYITSVLPILYILAKPAVGYLIDYFPSKRKFIFMLIIITTILCYGGFYFVPLSTVHPVPYNKVYSFSATQIAQCDSSVPQIEKWLCANYRKVSCPNDVVGYITSVASTNRSSVSDLKICFSADAMSKILVNENQTLNCLSKTDEITLINDCFYQSVTFWSFVLLMCIGTIGFNVSNCVSDAVCFDMLGEKTMRYGSQRVWGTIGFGIAALLSGYVVYIYQREVSNNMEKILPALYIMLIFGILDIFCIKWLKLPKFTNEGESILSKVTALVKQKPIMIFLVFATLAGVLDSFIIYYMFWFLEEVAEKTNYMESIKLIEGCVVAAECLGGEILFFLISGKILKKIGYVHCLSLCFFMYFIRLGLISMMTNPWYLVLIELFMQGPTYALCYTCIVAYASAVSPPGTSTTVQGLVAGMDDGVGFAIGSLIGGQLYKKYGGVISFRIFALAALVTCFAHYLLRAAAKDKEHLNTCKQNQQEMQKLQQNELNRIEIL